MNTLRDPVGPESKGVYVRRRLLVLGGLLAIIVFVALVIWKPGSSGGAASAPDVKVPDEIVAADKAQNPNQKVGEIQPCPAGQIAVTPLVDRESYAEGELPMLSLRVENTGADACEAQLGTSGMSFMITSGSDQVWRSTDCQVSPDTRAVILEPKKPLETEPIQWDRTRSSPETCDVPRDPVVAEGATYHLQVEAAGVPGDGTAPFLLY